MQAKWRTIACHGQLRIWLNDNVSQETVASTLAAALQSSTPSASSSSCSSSSDGEAHYVRLEKLGYFCKRAQSAAFAEHESRIYKELIDCGLDELCCPRFHGLVHLPELGGKFEEHWLVMDDVPGNFTKQDWRSASLVAAGLESLLVLHACGICHGDVDPTRFTACPDETGRYGASPLKDPYAHNCITNGQPQLLCEAC